MSTERNEHLIVTTVIAGRTPEIDLAEAAYEAIRTINHQTITLRPIPAPDLYQTLGSLYSLGHGLAQALKQLSACLQASLLVHDVFEEDGADPVTRTGNATADMEAAALHADKLGELLESAQDELSRQGYHADESDWYDDEPEEGDQS